MDLVSKWQGASLFNINLTLLGLLQQTYRYSTAETWVRIPPSLIYNQDHLYPYAVFLFPLQQLTIWVFVVFKYLAASEALLKDINKFPCKSY